MNTSPTHNGQSVDIGRCLSGMRQIVVGGLPDTPMRLALIEEAIRLIQVDPQTAMATQYLGIKQYASFGDQREDHSYGADPRLGKTVFSIGRVRGYRGPIEPDAIYFLQCVRDAGLALEEAPAPGDVSGQNNGYNLGDVLRERDALCAKLERLNAAIGAVIVDVQE